MIKYNGYIFVNVDGFYEIYREIDGHCVTPMLTGNGTGWKVNDENFAKIIKVIDYVNFA